MAPNPSAKTVVRRLERSISNAIGRHDRVVLAYSGGLKSTLVAMIARKRCDLRCVVAGAEGSADVEAGKSAKQHLDYRMETILLDSAEVRRIDRQLAADLPGLTAADRNALIPLHAVIEITSGSPLLSGFARPIRASIVAALDDAQVGIPLHSAQQGGPISRTEFRAAALDLALPASWAHVRHRAPPSGAGIEEFIP